VISCGGGVVNCSTANPQSDTLPVHFAVITYWYEESIRNQHRAFLRQKVSRLWECDFTPGSSGITAKWVFVSFLRKTTEVVPYPPRIELVCYSHNFYESLLLFWTPGCDRYCDFVGSFVSFVVFSARSFSDDLSSAIPASPFRPRPSLQKLKGVVTLSPRTSRSGWRRLEDHRHAS
jgi:hypothetical protein